MDPNPYKSDSGQDSPAGQTGTESDAGTRSDNKCVQTTWPLNVRSVDKLDLLMMVDNSNSMVGEQQSLKREFPKLINVLTTGYRYPDDPNPFPPVKDMHVGVVSSDMGIPGVELGACHADGGDDGRLQNVPHGDSCDAAYPSFLRFIGDPNVGPVSDPNKLANDVACIAALGTSGCGFEQQLESPFKALWPKLYQNADGNIVSPNPYRFVSISEEGTWGRGDVPIAQGGNAGFLRNAATEGQSLVAILVVTDEEDCSVKSTEHLKPNNQLPSDSPYRTEDINLRCYLHKEFLYDIQERYLKGFRALRPGNEELVVFAAIAGVPTDLVDDNTLSQVDFSDDAQRDAFYNNILSDARMQEQIDPSTMPGSGTGNLTPSCVRMVPDESSLSTAFPPRRIVQLAQLFGDNGIVQSICQDDFGPALGAVINTIARHLGEACLPRPLTRQSNGLVPCDVIWELPAQAPPGTPTPTSCDQLPFLGPVNDGSPATNARGGVNCMAQQIAVTNPGSGLPPDGEGWFYDDFSQDVTKTCKPDQRQRVAFTLSAKPPTGVALKLECRAPVSVHQQSEPSSGDSQPTIGTTCDKRPDSAVSGDEACRVVLNDGTQDSSLFCHPGLSVCMRECTSNADCPAQWMCDQTAEAIEASAGHGAFCIDPQCRR